MVDAKKGHGEQKPVVFGSMQRTILWYHAGLMRRNQMGIRDLCSAESPVWNSCEIVILATCLFFIINLRFASLSSKLLNVV